MQTPSPSSSTIQILINQGMNSSASPMAGQMLNEVFDKINSNVREQALAGFQQKNSPVSVKQAAVLAEPIKTDVVNVNSFGKMAAPLFPWFGHYGWQA